MPNPDEKSSRKRAAATTAAATATSSRKDALLLVLQEEEGAAHPYRNTSDLHTCRETYKCALNSACISCAYKIAAFDIALDSEFTQSVPNVRPEMCPRINSTNNGTSNGNSTNNGNIPGDGIAYGYQEGMNILTVGDGDFSFSLALARIIMHKHKHGNDNQHRKSSYLVATSYESHDTLKRVYPNIDDTIEQLLKLNVQVCYEVDATNLSKTLPAHVQSQSESQSKTSSSSSSSPFHRIIWNFPCTAIQNGQDGQNQQMHENQMLVKKFVKGCQSFLCPLNGEIQFMHKTKPPYDQWELERIAVEVVPDADPCPFEYKGRVVFDRCLLPPYVPRKALDKKSFPCHDACLFVFGLKDKIGRAHTRTRTVCSTSTGKAHGTNRKQEIGFDPTIPGREHDHEHNHDHDQHDVDDAKNNAKDETQSQVLPVTLDIIDEIRFMHLSIGSYKDRKKRKVLRG